MVSEALLVCTGRVICTTYYLIFYPKYGIGGLFHFERVGIYYCTTAQGSESVD